MCKLRLTHAIDNKLLNLLMENARAGYSDLATEVGLSRVAVKNRITDMEEMGLIQGYRVKLAPRKVNNATLKELPLEAEKWEANKVYARIYDEDDGDNDILVIYDDYCYILSENTSLIMLFFKRSNT